MSFALNTATAVNAQLTDTGSDVGIGTSQPQDRFHIFERSLPNGQVHDVLRIQANTNGQRQPGFGARINFSFNKYGNIATGTSSTLGAISVYDANNGSSYGTMAFATREHYSKPLENKMWLDRFGNLGIGTDQPDAKLAVKGDIHAQEVKVDLNGAVAPDFVFEKGYELRTLTETEEYIKANKHLPEIPPASEMKENGFELKEMNLKLLQKIEELTLYLIQQNKQNEVQQAEIETLKIKITQMEKNQKDHGKI